MQVRPRIAQIVRFLPHPRIAQTVRFLPHPRIAQTVQFRQFDALVSDVHLCSWGRLKTISSLSLASLTNRAMQNWATTSARHAMSMCLRQRAACAIIGRSARSIPAPLANLMRAFSHHKSWQRRGLCNHLRCIPWRVMLAV